MNYGDTGTAVALGALYVDGLGTIENPDIESQTGLSLGCSVVGNGTSLLKISHSITNATASPTSTLRFFSFVDPDGNGRLMGQELNDVPGISFTGSGASEADFYGVDAVANLDPGSPGNLDYEIFENGQLTDTNYCGSFCDMVAALEFDLGVLGPGETGTITVGLSDSGQTISQRLLTAARANSGGIPDDPNTVLTISGTFVGPPPPPLSIPALPSYGAHLLSAAVLVWARSRLKKLRQPA